MSKIPNIIQRRELEPLLQKADKIAQHYEKAANCAAFVIKPECSTSANQYNFICKQCCTDCGPKHLEAAEKVRELGSSLIYTCAEKNVFWISPFYSGGRFAGALLSGGLQNINKNAEKVRALAKLLQICADQISGVSFTQKNIAAILDNTNLLSSSKEYTPENEKSEAFSMDMERMLLANLRRGDIEEAGKLLIKLLKARYNEVNSSIPAFRLKALELAVLLSRATANPDDINDDETLEENRQYQKKINESTSIEEIESILLDIIDNMS